MKFLSRRFVGDYQARLIELFGGSHGIRDPGLLDSALAQPQATFGGQYLHSDISAMAAAYGFHLCQNHAFVDGNKRIATVAMATFLALNGHELIVGEVELYEIMMSVAAGRLDKAGLAAWLRRVATP